MCLVLRMHTCHLLSTHQSLWLEETRSMVTARAFAWTHFPCLSFSLLLSFLFIFILSAFGSCFMGSSRLSLNFSVLPLAVV